MNKFKNIVLLVLSIFVLTPAFANSPTKAELYEGIEITVNINSASAEELAVLLVGVGEKKAQEIVSYRDKHGAFTSVEDLASVKGIGTATINKNRERIKL